MHLTSSGRIVNCYCGVGGKCGPCERCRQPGHTQGFPGGVPLTLSMCDDCGDEAERIYIASGWQSARAFLCQLPI